MTVKRLSLLCLTQCQILTPADTTTTTTVSECPKCGTIGKSGKTSCCARGGAWFNTCGGAGNTKLHHTWYEGIQACKSRSSQSNIVIAQQLDRAQQKKDAESSQGTKYKSPIAVTKTFAFTLVKTSAPISHTTSIVTPTYTPDNVPITTSARKLLVDTSKIISITFSTHTSASTSIGTQGYRILLKFIVLLIFYIYSS